MGYSEGVPRGSRTFCANECPLGAGSCPSTILSIGKVIEKRMIPVADKSVFISYSHDTEEHRSWVREVAEYFVKNGVDAFFDQWDLEYGDDLALFMEKGITEADRVILVCTDAYIQKANEGQGGVGYERTIVTSEMMGDAAQRRKFIPIVRNVEGSRKLPTFLGAKYYADLSEGSDTDAVLDGLLKTVLELPPTKPTLGSTLYIPENPPAEDANPIELDAAPDVGVGTACVAFNERFGQAFPGVRGIEWFEDISIIRERLEILMAAPLFYDDGHLAWWWRGGRNLHIDRFSEIEGSHFLMGHSELNVSRMAAVDQGSYYRCFVYLEMNADQPTGASEWGEADIRRWVDNFGYASEEFGLVDGTLPVSREEYDDGAAIVDGKPVDIRDRVELRSRYLAPYNVIIAPNCSPINNTTFDQEFGADMNKILRGESSLELLVEKIRRLPRRH